MDIKKMMKLGKVLVVIFIVNFLVSLGLLGILLWSVFIKEDKPDLSELHLKRAGVYSANGLFRLASEEYRMAGELSEGERAINFWIKAGDICYKELEDYECAVRNYLDAKIGGKDFSKEPELASRLVDALKRLGRTESATALLSELTALSPGVSSGSTVVARLGEMRITMVQLRRAFQAEPAELKRSFSGEDGMRSYLEHYLFRNVLYQSALEENIVDDDLREMMDGFKRNYLAEMYFRKKLMSQVKVSEDELRDYYEKNLDAFKDSSGRVKNFKEARLEVEQRLKEKKLEEIKKEWFKEQAQKRGIYIYSNAFGNKK